MLITLAVWDFILFFLTVFVIDFEIFLKSNVKVSVKKEKNISMFALQIARYSCIPKMYLPRFQL